MSIFSPTLRFEAKVIDLRPMQLMFEYRIVRVNYMGEWKNFNSLHLSLCYAFGKDYRRGEKPLSTQD
jgi:hypothetical protein